MEFAETLQLMGAGFVNALTPLNLLMMIGGTAMGIIIGCLPGLSAAMGVALTLPLTFTMEPETGRIVLGLSTAALSSAAQFPPYLFILPVLPPLLQPLLKVTR